MEHPLDLLKEFLTVAKIIKKEIEQGNQLSQSYLQCQENNELINLSQSIAEDFDKRELDVLLSLENKFLALSCRGIKKC